MPTPLIDRCVGPDGVEDPGIAASGLPSNLGSLYVSAVSFGLLGAAICKGIQETRRDRTRRGDFFSEETMRRKKKCSVRGDLTSFLPGGPRSLRRRARPGRTLASTLRACSRRQQGRANSATFPMKSAGIVKGFSGEVGDCSDHIGTCHRDA